MSESGPLSQRLTRSKTDLEMVAWMRFIKPLRFITKIKFPFYEPYYELDNYRACLLDISDDYEATPGEV